MPARRLRALAFGDDAALRDWIANESAVRLAEARRDARLALERIAEANARVLTVAEPAYPGGLRQLTDPPPFLIVTGSLGASIAATGTAIVGTRSADPDAEAFARALAGRVPAPVVSGLARGIDAAAHRGALAAAAPTIAYVAHGLGATFPPEHADLERDIVASGGAVASERLPGERATRRALVRRDRLQAAHAATLVLVQTDLAGGAMHTVAAARRLGRRILVCEPRDAPRYDGNARVLAEGGAERLSWSFGDALSAVWDARG